MKIDYGTIAKIYVIGWLMSDGPIQRILRFLLAVGIFLPILLLAYRSGIGEMFGGLGGTFGALISVIWEVIWFAFTGRCSNAGGCFGQPQNVF